MSISFGLQLNLYSSSPCLMQYDELYLPLSIMQQYPAKFSYLPSFRAVESFLAIRYFDTVAGLLQEYTVVVLYLRVPSLTAST